MLEGANIARSNNEADLIVETLVNEIIHCSRWSAVVDAWRAILTVRGVSAEMEAERQHIMGAGNGAIAGAPVSSTAAIGRNG